MSRRWSAVLLLAVLLLAACGQSPAAIAPSEIRDAPVAVASTVPVAAPSAAPPAASPTTPTAESFVGRVADSDAFIALVADGTRVTAYICDGQTTAAWLSGEQRGDTVALTNDEGMALTAQIRSGAGGPQLSRGMLNDATGAQRTFATDRASALGRAGLYRAAAPAPATSSAPADAKASVGVIVLASGEHRGAYWARETITPVTDISLGEGSLAATVPGVGTFQAARVNNASGWGARSAPAVELVADRRASGRLSA